MPGDLWSQFWFQLFSFMVIRERSRDHFASVKDDLRISLDFGLRIWKAGWVQALAGSNPASSADCGLGGEPVCEHGVVAHLVEHATTVSNLTLLSEALPRADQPTDQRSYRRSRARSNRPQ